MPDPFHEGEIEVQTLTGERDQAAVTGRLIAGAIPAGARGFLDQQIYCALGWADEGGDIWASLLAGEPGFASADDQGATLTLRLDDPAGVLSRTPPWNRLRAGDPVGALFADLSTRRRLRVNGSVLEVENGKLVILVEEAYPNCAKYIQKRRAALSSRSVDDAKIQAGRDLTDELRAWLSEADTFFVASAYPGGKVDASHRGGTPGFIRLTNDTLRFPDYPGNSMFGTLGNFAVNPRAGLVFLDFVQNRQLQLTGNVTLDLQSGGDPAATGNTGRWWEFKPRRWIISPLNKIIEWGEPEASPFNP